MNPFVLCTLAGTVVVTGLCGAAGSAAAAAPERTSLTAAAVLGPAVDGREWAAWSPDEFSHTSEGRPGRVVIRHDRTGARKIVDLPRACHAVTVPDGRDGRFVAECFFESSTYTFVIHASTGAVTAIGDDASRCASYHRIGRYWLEGISSCSGHSVVIYTNWRTSETVSDEALVNDARIPYDLDRPQLRALARPAPTPFAVDGALVLAQRKRGRGPRAPYSVTLERGKGRNTRLGACDRECAHMSLGGGLAAWGDGSRLNGYALRARRSLRWTLPAGASLVGTTEKRVYLRVPSASKPRTGDLRSFRWRR